MRSVRGGLFKDAHRAVIQIYSPLQRRAVSLCNMCRALRTKFALLAYPSPFERG